MDTIDFFRVYHHWEDPKPYIALKGNPAPDGCKAWIRSLKGTGSHVCWFKIQCHEFIGYSTATERDIAYLRSVVDEWLARAGLFLDDFTLGRIDYEFLFSKRQYAAITGRERKDNDVIAYHLRQSFKPGEITSELANKIGYDLAMSLTRACLKNKYCTNRW